MKRCVLLIACIGIAVSAGAADLKIMTTGLGTGTVRLSTGTTCTSTGGDCDPTFTGSITLTAEDGMDSTFAGWNGDCAPRGTMRTCTLDDTSTRAVRAKFNPSVRIPTITDFSPGGIRTYLGMNTRVDTPAEFLAALPDDFRQNWMIAFSASLARYFGNFAR